MEHAIDNKEIGFIVFSKLTSHDWAQHLRLSAPKERVYHSKVLQDKGITDNGIIRTKVLQDKGIVRN